MSEVNEGVQIILNRMESNPEEFFGDQQKWRWIFNENLREVMTEPEKAAIFEAMKKVRRLELTAKAVATVMPSDDEDDDYASEEDTNRLLKAPLKTYPKTQTPKKMYVNAAQAEMIKRMSGGNKA